VVYFFDSSGVVKRYVDEIGSKRVIELTLPEAEHVIYLSRIAGVEVISALSRLKRAGQLSDEDAKMAIEQFRHDFSNQYKIIEITSEVIERAMNLAERHFLRGYDATHLASAVELQTMCQVLKIPSPVLICSDVALNEAAKAENIIIEDPGDYEAGSAAQMT